jgi:hypothetical protein
MAVVPAMTGRWIAAQPMLPSSAVTDSPSAPKPPTDPATRPPRRSGDIRMYTHAAAQKAMPPSTNQGPHRYQRLMVRNAGSMATLARSVLRKDGRRGTLPQSPGCDAAWGVAGCRAASAGGARRCQVRGAAGAVHHGRRRRAWLPALLVDALLGETGRWRPLPPVCRRQQATIYHRRASFVYAEKKWGAACSLTGVAGRVHRSLAIPAHGSVGDAVIARCCSIGHEPPEVSY